MSARQQVAIIDLSNKYHIIIVSQLPPQQLRVDLLQHLEH